MSRLCLNESLASPEFIRSDHGHVGLYSAASPGREPTRRNEDSAAVLPIADGMILAVADGMGGAVAGDAASSVAIEKLAESVAEIATAGMMPRTAIMNGVERANEAVCAIPGGAATTLAVVEIVDGFARPYHVGDSLILICGGRGKLKLMPVAHAPVAYGVEAGLISESQAMLHHERHLVSNYLGSKEMRIEVGPAVQLSPRDTVVVASDGLSDNLLSDEIISMARHGALERSLTSLIELAQSRMESEDEGVPHKPDDLTVLQYRLH